MSSMLPGTYYTYDNPRVNQVIYGGAATTEFTIDDWMDLAIAALDQGGLSERAQRRVEELAAHLRETEVDESDDASE